MPRFHEQRKSFWIGQSYNVKLLLKNPMNACTLSPANHLKMEDISDKIDNWKADNDIERAIVKMWQYHQQVNVATFPLT